MRNNVGLYLTKRAHLDPAQEAVVEIEQNRRFTYRELNLRANRVADALAARGTRRGDRVALLLKNGVEYVESYFAIAKIGALMVPLNWRLVPDELELILNDAGASLLIYDRDLDDTVDSLVKRQTEVKRWIRVGQDEAEVGYAENYRNLLDEGSEEEPSIQAQDDDPLFIVYTSGTTGLPKGAMHSHKSMIWASLTWLMSLDIRQNDRFLFFLPTFHVGVILPLTMIVQRGGVAVLMRSFDVSRVFEALERENISTSVAVPTMLKSMLEYEDRKNYDYSSLRWIIVGAGAVPAPLLERYSELGIHIFQDYGLTESCGPAAIASPEEAVLKPASAGKACFHTDVRVVDEAGKDALPGRLGEVLVRASHVMQGYWNQPGATSETIRDGWLHTGDLGTLDEDGCLFIKDRKKDMIISGGENIYPAEIENVLLRHPAIKEVAVIGQPSNKWVESPAAVVVLRSEKKTTEEEIRRYCRNKIASYKIPRVVEFIDQLPRTPTGKVQKHVLRKRFPGPAPE